MNERLGALLRDMTMEYKEREGVDELSAALKAADEVKEAVDTLIGSAVVILRMFGKSWSDIGDGFGISRQAAWERFNPLLQLAEERGRMLLEDGE